MPVFSDLWYLCHNWPVRVQQLIARHPAFIRKVVKVCQVFAYINPNMRVASSHVECETDAWIRVFNTKVSLSPVIKVYGEAFAFPNPTQLVDAITTVMQEILTVYTLWTDRLDKEMFSKPMLHEVEFSDAQYRIIDFNVLEGWRSHWGVWRPGFVFAPLDFTSSTPISPISPSSIVSASSCERNFRACSGRVQPHRKVLNPAAAAPDVEGVKKCAAKTCQEAIMAGMKAQQANETSDELSSYGTCIVCQEDLHEAKVFGPYIRKHPDSHSQFLNERMTIPQSFDRASPHDTTFPPANAEELDTASLPNFDGFPTQYARFRLYLPDFRTEVASARLT
ncbi:hypothetical protein BDR05DRAFT_1006022 [Suillus weaverae]|nr:hypothetical protein BDR05DRAFT_1006022 [Suillus weaverae]